MKSYWYTSAWKNGNTAVKNDDSIFLQATTSNIDSYSCGIATNNLISFGGYSKLCALVDSDANANNELFITLNNPISDYYNENRVTAYLHKSSVTYGTVEMDIADYQGSYQVSYLTVRNGYCRVYKIWLE